MPLPERHSIEEISRVSFAPAGSARTDARP
jgi:hypothetical protein